MKLSFIYQSFIINKKATTCALECKLRTDNKFAFPDIYVGKVSHCHPDDNFDANIGTKLALARAEMKAYKVAKKYAKCRLMEYYKKTKELESFIDKSNKSIEHNKEYIKKLINTEK
jgi:phage FluMu protein Com